jgi:hypothetical protein
MPADVRTLAQEAVELAGKATPGPWRSNSAFDIECDTCGEHPYVCDVTAEHEEGTAYSSLYMQLCGLESLCAPNAALITHAGTHYATIARALIEALDERDEARGSNILNRNAVRRLSAEKDALLAALPHALGICGCERVDVPGLHSGAGGPVYEWPEEHEAAREWLRGRIE